VPASGCERLGPWGDARVCSSVARGPANGLEGAAAQSTDTVMVLDELGMVDARDAAQSLYGLANGAGKARLDSGAKCNRAMQTGFARLCQAL
jgi:uncharacterized protein (DUF927 family)